MVANQIQAFPAGGKSEGLEAGPGFVIMHSIIIGDGLTEDFLSPEVQFIACQTNVGKNEIHRLIGRGRDYGQGPLPTFLKQARRELQQGAAVSLIFLRSVAGLEKCGAAGAAGSKPPAFTEPLAAVAADAYIVDTRPGAIPWQQLLAGIEKLAGLNHTALEKVSSTLRFLVVGCHTDKRILAVAIFLKNVLGFEQVAVSSHLVGSSAREAHFAALRHTLPGNGVRVILDIEDAAGYVGLSRDPLGGQGLQPCLIEPARAREALDENRRRIIELLCLHWTKTHLKPLQGGFSGSLLFLAEGWKAAARTEPLVVKIDSFPQMRREIDGYHLVKDFLGKHIPTFGYPVEQGGTIGVAMELAAMDGQPATLQDCFEAAESEAALADFIRRLDKALAIISQRLYRNTRKTSWVTPYRQFTLHTDEQLRFLADNTAFIADYLAAEKRADVKIDFAILPKILKLIAKNEDSLESHICIAHGDLNYQNVIYDRVDNIWFIDWTHCGLHPLELDFAKLESDVKFVISKHFEIEDQARLKQFEAYLLAHRLPAGEESLPENLKFAKWDLRFRKILVTVRRIREAYFALKEDDDWLVYRIALLKYALHSLSFDKRSGRGECEPPQLVYACLSAHRLLLDLVSDDFHLKIRGERPSSYPPRQRVSIDEAPWSAASPDHAPPYHTDPSVLENDYQRRPGGWADPEDFSRLPRDRRPAGYRRLDEQGRPLNPRGRTGIAGRGLLGRWGPNHAAGALVVRENHATAQIEIVLGKKQDGHVWSLPKGFVQFEENPMPAAARVLEHECGWRPHSVEAEVMFEGLSYDPRQTDHAWVESHIFLFYCEAETALSLLHPGGEFEEVAWQPLNAETINDVHPGQAQYLRDVVDRLREQGRLDAERARAILSETG
jgi:ADP-ribose pyrophosphatase